MKIIPGREREKEKKAETAEKEAPKSISLSVLDRIVMGQFFPEKGNYMTNLLMEDIGKKVRISQAEMKEIGMRTEERGPGGAKTLWDGRKAKDKKFVFTSAEIAFLRSRVEFMDQRELITPDIMPLIKKIKEA